MVKTIENFTRHPTAPKGNPLRHYPTQYPNSEANMKRIFLVSLFAVVRSLLLGQPKREGSRSDTGVSGVE